MTNIVGLIYPYSKENSPIIMYLDLLQDNFDKIYAISPHGWGYTGKDAGEIVGAKDTGIIISDNLEDIIGSVNTVFLGPFDNFFYSGDIIEDTLMTIIKHGTEKLKKIMFLQEIDFSKYNTILKELKSRVLIWSPNKNKYNNLLEKSRLKEICSITTPIIGVFGDGKNTNKFNVQLSLRRQLIGLGYKVSQLGSREYCELFGFASWPSLVFTNHTSEVDKIYLLNNLVKELEDVEQPDVIIVSAPSGVIPINEKFHNNFGIYAYELSNAVKIDALIYTTYYGNYDINYFRKINESLKGRLGNEVNCYIISNCLLNWNLLKNERRFQTNSLPIKYLEDIKYNDYNQEFNIKSFMNKEDEQMVAEIVINSLNRNIQVI